MKEAEPLSSKESSEVKIEFSQTISSDNINEYNEINEEIIYFIYLN